MYAIFVYPNELPYLKDPYLVETTAVTYLNQYVTDLRKEEILPKNEDFHMYFYDNFKHIHDRMGSVLITRTLLLKKEEYLNSEVKRIFKKADKYDQIEYHLPAYVWVVEISIPELFWINSDKVGEVIIDPEKFEKSPENSILLIRLPHVFSIFDKGSDGVWDYLIDQESPHQPLIKKTKGLLREI